MLEGPDLLLTIIECNVRRTVPVDARVQRIYGVANEVMLEPIARHL